MKTSFLKTFLFSAGVAVATFTSCSQKEEKSDSNLNEVANHSDTLNNNQMEAKEALMEIAIRKIKSGKDADFVAARTAFITKLKAQEGIEKDWEFKSFFTMPVQDDTDVFVGMTRYESAEAMQTIAGKLMASEEAQNFFGTFDMKAFVAVKPADGGSFKLEDHIKAGNVLEVAVRSPKAGKEGEFDAKRKAFFDLIAAQKGYIFDREFIDLQTGAKVVLIGWESIEAFQAGAGALQKKPEMGDFFGILDVKAYQALVLANN